MQEKDNTQLVIKIIISVALLLCLLYSYCVAIIHFFILISHYDINSLLLSLYGFGVPGGTIEYSCFTFWGSGGGEPDFCNWSPKVFGAMVEYFNAVESCEQAFNNDPKCVELIDY